MKKKTVFLTKAIALMLIAALVIPSAGVVNAQAKSKKKGPSLSTKSLKLTQWDKTYTVKVKNAGNKKITWSIKPYNGGLTTVSSSTHKKSFSVKPRLIGTGTIICKVGSKKLKCSYSVSCGSDTFNTIALMTTSYGTVSDDGETEQYQIASNATYSDDITYDLYSEYYSDGALVLDACANVTTDDDYQFSYQQHVGFYPDGSLSMSDLSYDYLDSNNDWQRIYLVYADDLDISSYTDNSYYDFSVQERDSDVYQDDASVSDDANNIYPVMLDIMNDGLKNYVNSDFSVADLGFYSFE